MDTISDKPSISRYKWIFTARRGYNFLFSKGFEEGGNVTYMLHMIYKLFEFRFWSHFKLLEITLLVQIEQFIGESKAKLIVLK